MLNNAVVTMDGEKYSREFVVDVETKTVAITHVSKCDDDQKVHMSYLLDMSGLTEEELFGHAARNCNIQWIRPSLFRKIDSSEAMKLNGTTIDAGDHRPSKIRGPADPEKSIKNGWKKIDLATKQAMMAEMQAELDAELAMS